MNNSVIGLDIAFSIFHIPYSHSAIKLNAMTLYELARPRHLGSIFDRQSALVMLGFSWIAMLFFPLYVRQRTDNILCVKDNSFSISKRRSTSPDSKSGKSQ